MQWDGSGDALWHVSNYFEALIVTLLPFKINYQNKKQGPLALCYAFVVNNVPISQLYYCVMAQNSIKDWQLLAD